MGGSDGGALFHSFRLRRTHGFQSHFLCLSFMRARVFYVCACVLRRSSNNRCSVATRAGRLSAIDFSSHSKGACDLGHSFLTERFSFLLLVTASATLRPSRGAKGEEQCVRSSRLGVHHEVGVRDRSARGAGSEEVCELSTATAPLSAD